MQSNHYTYVGFKNPIMASIFKVHFNKTINIDQVWLFIQVSLMICALVTHAFAYTWLYFNVVRSINGLMTEAASHAHVLCRQFPRLA
jgi:hypothetical protein